MDVDVQAPTDQEMLSAVLSDTGEGVIKLWLSQGLVDANTHVTMWAGAGAGFTLLYTAVLFNNPKIVSLLLNDSICVSPPTLLECALRLKLSMVKLLIEHGVSPSGTDHEGNNILHLLSNETSYSVKSVALFIYFIQVGCDINHQNLEGMTPLHKLCFTLSQVVVLHNGDPRLVKPLLYKIKALVQAKCKIDIYDLFGWTVVDQTAMGITNPSTQHYKAKILRMLVFTGADLVKIVKQTREQRPDLGIHDEDLCIVEKIVLQRHLHSLDFTAFDAAETKELDTALEFLFSERSTPVKDKKLF